MGLSSVLTWKGRELQVFTKMGACDKPGDCSDDAELAFSLLCGVPPGDGEVTPTVILARPAKGFRLLSDPDDDLDGVYTHSARKATSQSDCAGRAHYMCGCWFNKRLLAMSSCTLQAADLTQADLLLVQARCT